jgi:aminoglycoside phosphotransferase (APT) family kinase protein
MSPEPTETEKEALRSYLAEKLGESDSFSLEPFEGGNANETLALEWGDDVYALRKPPAAEPAPEMLHGLLREYEVLDAVQETWVPAPDVVLACEDESIIGDPFYAMESLEGDVLEVAEPQRFQTQEERRRIGAETVDTLAKIHNVDVDRVGLSSFGGDDPTEYLLEQVEELTEQLEWAQERTAESRELTVCFEVADWLSENVPEAEHHTLVHGDYKLDNIMFASGTPARIAGVLDWEMSTLGDPLADLGWLLSYWTEDGDPSPVTDDIQERYGDHEYFPMLDVYAEEYSCFTRNEGYHTRAELVERYEKQTGFEYTNDTFYRALGVFKLAALCDGFYRMFLEDAPNTKESYPLMELMVPTLGRQARQIIDGETPL